MRTIELGDGKIKVTPCYVSDTDRRQALLFEPVSEAHPIGILTGDPDGPYTPKDEDTLLVLGSVEAAKVIIHQLQVCVSMMEKK